MLSNALRELKGVDCPEGQLKAARKMATAGVP
jgi:hypothetical protein